MCRGCINPQRKLAALLQFIMLSYTCIQYMFLAKASSVLAPVLHSHFGHKKKVPVLAETVLDGIAGKGI